MRDEDTRLLEIFTAGSRGLGRPSVDDFLPPGRTWFFGYGRQALAAGLQRAGIGRGDTVLLPAFICRELLASLRHVGTAVRFYPVTENLQTDEETLERTGPAARAVVAVNYFGFPQDLGPFRAWCSRTGALLVEDNAHGFLSREDSLPLGLRGDLGVFSLRKTLPLPNGGALVDSRKEGKFPEGIPLLFEGDSRGEDRRYRMKAVLRAVMRAGGLRVARTIIDGVRTGRWVVRGSRLPRPRADGESFMPPQAFSPLAKRLLRRCDLKRESARRRGLYEKCVRLLSGERDVRPIFPDLPSGVVPFGFPFRFQGSDVSAFVSSWWRRGVPMHCWPDLPDGIQASAPDHCRNVMMVPFLW